MCRSRDTLQVWKTTTHRDCTHQQIAPMSHTGSWRHTHTLYISHTARAYPARRTHPAHGALQRLPCQRTGARWGVPPSPSERALRRLDRDDQTYRRLSIFPIWQGCVSTMAYMGGWMATERVAEDARKSIVRRAGACSRGGGGSTADATSPSSCCLCPPPPPVPSKALAHSIRGRQPPPHDLCRQRLWPGPTAFSSAPLPLCRLSQNWAGSTSPLGRPSPGWLGAGTGGGAPGEPPAVKEAALSFRSRSEAETAGAAGAAPRPCSMLSRLVPRSGAVPLAAGRGVVPRPRCTGPGACLWCCPSLARTAF